MSRTLAFLYPGHWNFSSVSFNVYTYPWRTPLFMSISIPPSSEGKQAEAVKLATTSVCQPLCMSPTWCSCLTLNFCKERQRAVWNLSFFISNVILLFASPWVKAAKNSKRSLPTSPLLLLWWKMWMSTTTGNFDRGPVTLMRPFACRATTAGVFILKTNSVCLILIMWSVKVSVRHNAHAPWRFWSMRPNLPQPNRMLKWVSPCKVMKSFFFPLLRQRANFLTFACLQY